jgi:hypothetical protein
VEGRGEWLDRVKRRRGERKDSSPEDEEGGEHCADEDHRSTSGARPEHAGGEVGGTESQREQRARQREWRKCPYLGLGRGKVF